MVNASTQQTQLQANVEYSALRSLRQPLLEIRPHLYNHATTAVLRLYHKMEDTNQRTRLLVGFPLEELV